MSNTRLTQRQIDALKPRKNTFDVRDTELKGFGVRVRSSGIKRYFVQSQHEGDSYLAHHRQSRRNDP